MKEIFWFSGTTDDASAGFLTYKPSVFTSVQIVNQTPVIASYCIG